MLLLPALQRLRRIDPLLLAPLLQHSFELLSRRWRNALEAIIDGGLAPGLAQESPARKLTAAEAALRILGLVQWVEPMGGYPYLGVVER